MKKYGPSKRKVNFSVKLDREHRALHTARGNKTERKKEMWPGNRRLIFFILSAQYKGFIYLFVVWLTTLKETSKNVWETILKGAVVA